MRNFLSGRAWFVWFLVSLFLSIWAISVLSQNDIQVGYAVLEVDEQNLPPIATALFSFRGSDGALVAEAGVAAVKLIRLGNLPRPGERQVILKRFEREARITAGLESPNTVRLFDLA